MRRLVMMIKQFCVAGWHYQIQFPEGYPLVEELLASSQPFTEQPTCSDGDLLFVMQVDDSFRPEDKGQEIGQFDASDNHYGIFQNTAGDYCIQVSDPARRQCAILQANACFSRVRIALAGKASMRSLGLGNAIMMAYAFASADRGTLLMHASVVRERGIGYLFLGESGTGKSTHTANWLRFIPGTDLLNDDNPVVRWTGQSVVVYGSPWSGKTPCYRQEQATVGAFVQLEQAPFNAIRSQETLEAFVSVLTSCSVMKWDPRVYGGICDTVTQVIGHVPTYHLQNLPDEAAVQLAHKTIASCEP